MGVRRVDEPIGGARELQDGPWVLDRFEGGFAVLEHAVSKAHADVPRDGLPEGAREGDVLTASGGRLTLDAAETRDRAERIRKKFEGLLE